MHQPTANMMKLTDSTTVVTRRAHQKEKPGSATLTAAMEKLIEFYRTDGMRVALMPTRGSAGGANFRARLLLDLSPPPPKIPPTAFFPLEKPATDREAPAFSLRQTFL